jgi:hypothetical protein
LLWPLAARKKKLLPPQLTPLLRLRPLPLRLLKLRLPQLLLRLLTLRPRLPTLRLRLLTLRLRLPSSNRILPIQKADLRVGFLFGRLSGAPLIRGNDIPRRLCPHSLPSQPLFLIRYQDRIRQNA